MMKDDDRFSDVLAVVGINHIGYDDEAIGHSFENVDANAVNVL